MSVGKFSRLPEFAKPYIYSIHLKPNLETFVCEGSERINIEILQSTSYLELHSLDIDVISVNLKLENGIEWFDLKYELNPKWQTLKIHLSQTIHPQKVELYIEFVAKHNDQMHGFYRSAYKDGQGETKYVVSTHFESTFARMSFPCWDEPLYKAHFNITLEVEEKLVALSNMHILSETVENGKKIAKFDMTPLMSTYMIAFAAGELEFIEAFSNNDIPIRVYTLPGQSQQAHYTLEVAIKSFNWYTNWFDFPQPLQKVDLLSVPDTIMGAMENWGLIICQDRFIIQDPLKTSSYRKMYNTIIISHEVAHFWFGNLVTMKWWTDLWLKEGFASFMSYLFTGETYPEYNVWMHFLKMQMAPAFELDGLRSSHPIVVPIENPNELDEIYDSITYEKSNCVLRMLCNYLGEPIFQEALRNYLKQFQYSNAETNNLWDELSRVSGQNIIELMSSWTKQMGFPLVNVEQRIESGKRILKLRQERFILDGKLDDQTLVWKIPINICAESSPDRAKFKILMTDREQEFELEGVQPNEWIKLNQGNAGFYRVQYTDKMLESFLPAIKNKKMHAMDRFGIANDLFSLVESGRIPATNFLDFVQACSNEDNHIVWEALDSGLEQISKILMCYKDGTTTQKRFHSFVSSILSPIAEIVGWESNPNEDSQMSFLRATILNRLAHSSHPETIKTFLQKFKKHFEDKVDLDKDLRPLIYNVIAKHIGKDGISKLLQILQSCGLTEIERDCLTAMAQVEDEASLEETFKFCILDKNTRPEDYPFLILGTKETQVGQKFIWKWFKENYKEMVSIYGSVNSQPFLNCLKYIVEGRCEEKFADEFEAFFKSHLSDNEIQIMDRPIRQSSEGIRIRSRLLNQYGQLIEEWLIKNSF